MAELHDKKYESLAHQSGGVWLEALNPQMDTPKHVTQQSYVIIIFTLAGKKKNDKKTLKDWMMTLQMNWGAGDDTCTWAMMKW